MLSGMSAYGRRVFFLYLQYFAKRWGNKKGRPTYETAPSSSERGN